MISRSMSEGNYGVIFLDKQSVLLSSLKELQNFKVFEGLSIDELSSLCEFGEIIVSKHKQPLFVFGEPADSFGVVLSGAFKLSRPSQRGEDTIVHFSTPGDVIAAFVMSQENPIYPVSSYAMGPSRFLKIPRKTFLHRWKERPDILFKVQSLLSHRIGSLQTQKTLIKAPLASKIAYLLIEILDKYDGEESIIPLPLTRKEIADSLGASVESVIRIMSDWSKKGLLETHGQQIKVLDLKKIIEELNVN